MAKETVLLYNCGGDEFKTLRALLMMLRVRVRMVEPSRYHLPLEQVAAGKGEEDPKQQADIPEAMMVFCDLRRCGAVRKPSKNPLTNPCKNCIITKRF